MLEGQEFVDDKLLGVENPLFVIVHKRFIFEVWFLEKLFKGVQGLDKVLRPEDFGRLGFQFWVWGLLERVIKMKVLNYIISIEPRFFPIKSFKFHLLKFLESIFFRTGFTDCRKPLAQFGPQALI
jgi:hypothetical protein